MAASNEVLQDNLARLTGVVANLVELQQKMLAILGHVTSVVGTLGAFSTQGIANLLSVVQIKEDADPEAIRRLARDLPEWMKQMQEGTVKMQDALASTKRNGNGHGPTAPPASS